VPILTGLYRQPKSYRLAGKDGKGMAGAKASNANPMKIGVATRCIRPPGPDPSYSM